jgi:hypothetical protein
VGLELIVAKPTAKPSRLTLFAMLNVPRERAQVRNSVLHGLRDRQCGEHGAGGNPAGNQALNRFRHSLPSCGLAQVSHEAVGWSMPVRSFVGHNLLISQVVELTALVG